MTGETPETDLDYVVEGIKAAYETRTEHGGEIRRINVEIAPLTTEDFKKLKEAKIGTYTCFQETYHRPTYKKMHPSGPKADYDWRLSVMDRAQQAGIDDIGIGLSLDCMTINLRLLPCYYILNTWIRPMVLAPIQYRFPV